MEVSQKQVGRGTWLTLTWISVSAHGNFSSNAWKIDIRKSGKILSIDSRQDNRTVQIHKGDHSSLPASLTGHNLTFQRPVESSPLLFPHFLFHLSSLSFACIQCQDCRWAKISKMFGTDAVFAKKITISLKYYTQDLFSRFTWRVHNVEALM